MQITFLLSRFLNGGIDTVIVRYLQCLANQSYKLRLIIGSEYKGLQPFEAELPAEVEVKYLLPESILTALPKKKLSHKLSAAEKIADAVLFAPVRRVLQRNRLSSSLKSCDVVVDFDSTFYSLLKGVPSKKIAFFHFSINKYHRGDERKLRRLCTKMSVYDKIVLICNKMAEEFASRAPELNDRISVIYNPIDEWQQRQKALEYVVSAEDYILSVGRLEEHQKDFTTLIKAYACAYRRNAQIPPLYIIGDGIDRTYLEKLAKEEGVAERVKFLGYLNNPMPWIANAKMFILSSKFEGLPTVLVEALMLDRVIVATGCPTGPAEILDNGNCGRLVPIADVDSLSNAIIDLLDNNELRSEILSNVSNHKKLFTPEHCITKFVELLQ